MRLKAVLSLIVILSTNLIVLAAKPSKELALERTIPFATEGAKNIVLSPTESEEIYPAVIELEDKIEFKNNNGQTVKTVIFPKPYGNKTANQITYSQNLKYLLLHTTVGEERIGENDSITVFDTLGQIAWSTRAAYGSHYIAPNGQYAVCLFPNVGSPHYPPTFLNKDGILNSDIVNYNFASRSHPEISPVKSKYFR